MRRLLEGRRLLERGTYFNVDTQRCDAYQRAALICGAALIRGNTVNIPFQSSDSSDKFLTVPWFYKQDSTVKFFSVCFLLVIGV